MTSDVFALDPGTIKAACQFHHHIGCEIIAYASLASTNDEAKRLAHEGLSGGTVIVADLQTQGRGTQGRTWWARKGEALLFSVILYPPKDQIDILVTLATTAICETLRDFLPADSIAIKSPNDVILNDKKVAGVLVESAICGTFLEYAIIGIGLNVNVRQFPRELANSATSMYRESGLVWDRQKVLVALLAYLEKGYGNESLH